MFALGLACAVVYLLADRGMVRADGQVQGLLSILVIGAATDYAPLLAARVRKELALRDDRVDAPLAAVRRSAGAIIASAATVALGLPTLLASDVTNSRALGPVGALGIVCSVLVTLTFLPAVLVVQGRAVHWPATPKAVEAKAEGHRLWRRVAAVFDRAPRVPAGFSPALSSKGVPLNEIFVNDAPRPPPNRPWPGTSRAAPATPP